MIFSQAREMLTSEDGAQAQSGQRKAPLESELSARQAHQCCGADVICSSNTFPYMQHLHYSPSRL